MAVPDVTQKEVDDAFYKSYGEGSKKGLDPALAGTGGEGRRKLTLDPKDARFRECWMETRRLMRLERGLCVPEGAPIGTPATPCMKKGPKKDNPKFEPDLWNDYTKGGPIQTSTNCYAYAMDSRTGHPVGKKPQPGGKSKMPIGKPLDCDDIAKSVVADGKPDVIPIDRCPYNVEQKKPPPDKPGYYLVALVITPPAGFDATGSFYNRDDYHWYRQDEDGTWSHKPGHDVVTNYDSNGKAITNPETAAKRTVLPSPKYDVYSKKAGKMVPSVVDYTHFCRYMYVSKGGANI